MRGQPQALAQGRVLRQAQQLVGHGLFGVGHQQALVAVHHLFAQTGQVAGQHGQASTHGFEHGDGHAFVVGQQHKQLVLREQLGHLAHIARPGDLLQTQLGRQRLVLGQQGPVAGQCHRQLMAQPIAHFGQSAQQQVVPFGRLHARHHDQARRGVGEGRYWRVLFFLVRSCLGAQRWLGR